MSAAGAVVLVAVATPVVAATVKDGVDAWQRGDYARAVAAWRPLADQGDPDAAFNLAQAYKLGRGVAPDLLQAKTWYGKAARGGHIQAAANYGLLLWKDDDRKAAMPWISKAADGGDPRAQYIYGTALFNGDLAPRDWPRAYALMTRAAGAGLPQATTSLSQMNRYMSAADRQKGLQLATQLATQPTPPTTRIATAAPPSAPPAPQSVSRPIDLSAPRPAKTAALPVGAGKPTPTPSRPPAPFTGAGGRWRVQLGAYNSQPAASIAWGKIAGRLGGLAPRYERAGVFVRLRTGPLDRAGAERVCAIAKSAGTACFRIAPGG
jgi:hypothetical protein